MLNKEHASYVQLIINALSQAADGHFIEGKIFKSQGLHKLGEKFIAHSHDERKYVEQAIDRLLAYNVEVKLAARDEAPIIADPIEYLKHDISVSEQGLPMLDELMKAVSDDIITYDMLKAHYLEEEAELQWMKQQIDLVERIGKENWYALQV